MVVDALTNGRLLVGVGIAIGAIIFWSGGFVVANYLWNRWRGETGPRDIETMEDADE